MTTKTNTNKTKLAVALDWNKETARMEGVAKDKGGSRGDALGRVAKFLAVESPGASVLRASAGEAGAQAFIEQPRNVLAKLPKLATCIASKQPWCSLAGLSPDNRRKEDASVAIALGGLGAGDERQKAIVAGAIKRYPGGANAQMPAALEACALLGIVERKPGGPRNAEYSIANQKAAALLIPQA